jgi:hypothetical protein
MDNLSQNFYESLVNNCRTVQANKTVVKGKVIPSNEGATQEEIKTYF